MTEYIVKMECTVLREFTFIAEDEADLMEKTAKLEGITHQGPDLDFLDWAPQSWKEVTG